MKQTLESVEPREMKLRVDVNWQSQIFTEDIISFTLKKLKEECFDYVFIPMKYMIVLVKHQVQQLTKIP